jgi:hypothetical protein
VCSPCGADAARGYVGAEQRNFDAFDIRETFQGGEIEARDKSMVTGAASLTNTSISIVPKSRSMQLHMRLGAPRHRTRDGVERDLQ